MLELAPGTEKKGHGMSGNRDLHLRGAQLVSVQQELETWKNSFYDAIDGFAREMRRTQQVIAGHVEETVVASLEVDIPRQQTMSKCQKDIGQMRQRR